MKAEEFGITFLGTSAASINPYSPTSTCLFEGGGIKIIIDAGIGTLRQLHRIRLNTDGINAVLITHWHFDHYAGLPALLKSKKKTSLLAIYGPKPSILAMIYLTNLLHSASIHFEVITENFSKIFGNILIETVPTIHDIVSFGWILTERASIAQGGRRRIVISGDTRPTQALVRAAEEADLLVHEATYLNKNANRAYKHEHSTAAEAAEVAKKSQVGSLALTHISNNSSKSSALLEAGNIFPKVIVPSPLDKIYINPVPDDVKKETFGWGDVRMVENRITGKI